MRPTLTARLETQRDLYVAYMRFIPTGGLFLPNQPLYPLGTTVQLTIWLPYAVDATTLVGQIIWVTPASALHQTSGVGVQFTDQQASTVCQQIEHCLGEQLESATLTHTL